MHAALLSIKLLVTYALTKGRLPSTLSLDQFKHMTTKAYTLWRPQVPKQFGSILDLKQSTLVKYLKNTIREQFNNQ